MKALIGFIGPASAQSATFLTKYPPSYATKAKSSPCQTAPPRIPPCQQARACFGGTAVPRHWRPRP